MSFTNTINRTYNDGLANIGGVETITSDAKTDFDGSIAGSPTDNVQVDRAFTRANLKALCLYSDKACTVYTNDDSDGSPQDTIALPAGRALVWSLAHDGIGNCPFSDDVTVLYVSVTGSVAANLKIRALSDQTP